MKLVVNDHLGPGRYVGTAEEKDEDLPFEEKMAQLTIRLAQQFAEGNELDVAIRENLKGIGYES